MKTTKEPSQINATKKSSVQNNHTATKTEKSSGSTKGENIKACSSVKTSEVQNNHKTSARATAPQKTQASSQTKSTSARTISDKKSGR